MKINPVDPSNKQSKPLALACCSIIALAFLAFIFIIATAAPELTPEEVLANKNASAAKVCARVEVEKNLAAPSTADFGLLDAVLGNDGETYGIKSYVDSQNSFGTMIRTDFGCFVKVIDPDAYTCDVECAFE